MGSGTINRLIVADPNNPEYIEPDGKKVRNDRSYEKDYIAGRYGAIHFVGDFSKLNSDGKSN